MSPKFTLFSLLSQALSSLALKDGQSAYKPVELNVDVAVIGGGAAGTYAAVRLREDFNISVVVIEPKDHLGGSVSTYTVPETGETFEFGVQSYMRYGPAVDFFARFGIIPTVWASRRLTPLFADVETGKRLTGYVPPNINATNEAFDRWLNFVKKYADAFEPGYWGFFQPKEIPPELLTPFEQFAAANKIEAAVPRIMTISGVGIGGFEKLITFDVVQAFGYTLTKSMLDNTFFVPNGSNSLLYQRAQALLGKDVLLSSTVLDVERNWTHSTLHVKQGNTAYKINTKRILYTAPPSAKALAPYHIDEKEKAVFSQLKPIVEYIAVVHAPCLPENYTVTFNPSSIVPSNHLALREWPYNLRLDSTGPYGLGLFRLFFSANFTISFDEAKKYLQRDVDKLHSAGTIPSRCDVEVRAMSDHSRPQWYLSAEELKAGFVQDLYALQNDRGIWYSGYSWAAPYSSTVWAFTETVVPLILKDLRHNPS